MFEESFSDDEKTLIRSGDLFNTLGVIRAAHLYDGHLTKKRYIRLLNANYETDGFTEEIIDSVWDTSIKLMDSIGVLDSYGIDWLVTNQ